MDLLTMQRHPRRPHGPRHARSTGTRPTGSIRSHRLPGPSTIAGSAPPGLGGLGEGPRQHPLLAALDLPRLGSVRRGFPLLTRTLLFAAQEGRVVSLRWAQDRPRVRIFTWASVEPTLEVFDKTTGALLAKVELPGNAQGALMTDMVRGK